MLGIFNIKHIVPLSLIMGELCDYFSNISMMRHELILASFLDLRTARDVLFFNSSYLFTLFRAHVISSW